MIFLEHCMRENKKISDSLPSFSCQFFSPLKSIGSILYYYSKSVIIINKNINNYSNYSKFLISIFYFICLNHVSGGLPTIFFWWASLYDSPICKHHSLNIPITEETFLFKFHRLLSTFLTLSILFCCLLAVQMLILSTLFLENLSLRHWFLLDVSTFPSRILQYFVR